MTKRVYPLVLVAAMKDPIPLRHFGKKEMLAKINLMEDWFDVPMTFDESQIPAHVSLMAAGEEVGAWDYGVSDVWCLLGATGGRWQHPPWWQTCLGLHLRRRWTTPKATRSLTEITSWSR